MSFVNKLTSSLASLVISVSCVTQVQATLIGHWPFDEGSGTTIADVIGGKDGVYSEGSTSPGLNPTWIPGRVGLGAMKFNGNGPNEWVNVPGSIGTPGNPTDVQLNQTSYTVAVWARPDDLSPRVEGPFYAHLVSTDNGTSDCVGWSAAFVVDLGTAPDAWRFTIQHGEGFQCNNPAFGDAIPALGEWEHWAVTYDMNSSAHRIYKNGEVVGTFSGANPIGTNPFVSNAEFNLSFAVNTTSDTHLPHGGQFFNGALDDIRIYDEALSEEDIQDLVALANPSLINGDYNENATVDAADYVLWRKLLGTSATLPGENPAATTPGLVDQEDYNFWRSRFGATSGIGSGGNVAIPEPSSWLLGVLALMCGSIGVHRRRFAGC